MMEIIKKFKFSEDNGDENKLPITNYRSPKINTDDFYDFSSGISISNEEKQVWVDRIIKYMNENPDCNFYSHALGDSKVIVNRTDEGLSITICRGYLSAEIYEND